MNKTIKLTIYLLTSFLSLSFASSVSAAITIRPMLNTGLVGYWAMDEGAGGFAYDQSGNRNTGTLTQMDPTTDRVDGKLGKALDFDRVDDYVNIGNPASLQLTGSISISAWVKGNAFYGSGGNDDSTIVGKFGGNSYGWMLYVTNDNGPNQFMMHVSSSGADNIGRYSNTTVIPGQLYHVIGVYDAANQTINIYVNGVLDDGTLLGTVPSSMFDSSYNVTISGRNNGASNLWNGLIDEVRVYNRALSAGEVKRLYNLTKPKLLAPNNTGLVGYWSFEEGMGTKAGDMSGRGNNGDIIGASWADGKRGKALDFDGTNDYVTMGDINAIDGISALTYTLWVKPNNPSTLKDIIGKWSSFANNGLTLHTSSEHGADDILWGGWSGSIYGQTSSNWFTNNEWHFLVGVFDGNQSGDANRLKVYGDGILQTLSFSNSVPATTPDTAYDVRIGADSEGGRNFPGLIDEVRIYNRALSATEVASLYQSSGRKTTVNTSQNTQLTTGLVGLWSFNGPDISGSLALDKSGNGKNGTITGATASIGKVGQGLTFNGSSNSIDLGNVYNGVKSVTFWVKTSDTSDNGYFEGKLDEVRFYGSTLSAADIKRLYNMGASGSSQALTSVDPNTKILALNGTTGVKIVSGAVTASGWTSPTIYVDGAVSSSIDDNWRFVAITSATGINASASTLALGYAWECGDALVDPRDSKSYATVWNATSSQCWMKQGLNVGTKVNGGAAQDGYSGTTCTTIKKYCYSNATSTCDSTNNPNYPDGALYQWNQMMCGSTVAGVQGICPTGWHLPTDAEICTMEQAVDATITCGSTGWRGTDGGTKLKPNGTSGWEGNLAGYYFGGFVDRTTGGYFWSSSESGGSGAWDRFLGSGDATVYRNGFNKAGGFSVRCLKD